MDIAYWKTKCRAYKDQYATMTFADKQAFWRELMDEKDSPQEFMHVRGVIQALKHITNEGVAVDAVEFGGWDGKLAEQCLGANSQIVRWSNYDMCPGDVDNVRYAPVTLASDFWSSYIRPGNVFVSCHTLEHLVTDEVKKVMQAVSAFDWWVIEMPIPLAGVNMWTSASDTHMLHINWKQFHALARGFGFETVFQGPRKDKHPSHLLFTYRRST